MKTFFIPMLCIVLIISIASCENFNDPGENEYKHSTFINLKTGSSEQKIYIYKSLPLNYEFHDSHGGFSDGHLAEEVFSSDARILITGRNIVYEKFSIKNEGDSLNVKKCFANTEELNILPAEKYRLIIDSEGNNITGEIITTGDFHILNIVTENPGQNIYTLSWSKAENARYYRIRIIGYYTEWLPPIGRISGVNEKSYILDPDTVKASSSFSQRINVYQNYDSSRIVVEACDINLYDYYVKKIKKVNINNAYGFFGSSTVRELVIR